MDREQFYKLYWRHYLSIERDFLNTDEYVSIDTKNNHTFSNAYSKLFLTICSEIDSLSVEFCRLIKNDYDKKSYFNESIIPRMNTITEVYPGINTIKITTKFPYDEQNFVPFSKLTNEMMPDWWHSYNEYKHERTGETATGQPHYEKACLKNVITSLAALYLLCYLIDDYFDERNDGMDCVSRFFEFNGGKIVKNVVIHEVKSEEMKESTKKEELT